MRDIHIAYSLTVNKMQWNYFSTHSLSGMRVAKTKKIWKVNIFFAGVSRAKRVVVSTERSEGASSWGVWGGAVSPPNGVQGQRPGKFWDFSPSRCPEIAIPVCFQWLSMKNIWSNLEKIPVHFQYMSWKVCVFQYFSQYIFSPVHPVHLATLMKRLKAIY